MRIAVILSQHLPAFPRALTVATRLAPVLEELAARGHRLLLCDTGDGGVLPLVRGAERVRIRPPTLGSSNAAPVPVGRARTALRALAGAIVGQPPPPAPASATEGWLASNSEAGSVPGWAVRAAADLGADVVLATPPHGPADLLLLAEPSPAHVKRLLKCNPGEFLGASGLDHALQEWQRAVAGAALLASPGAVQRAVLRRQAFRLAIDLPLGPDTSRFNPGASSAGDALRNKLGIGASELVCLWLPPTFLGDGAPQAARAFAALTEGSAGVRDRMRFLFPDAIPPRALEILRAADCAERALAVPARDGDAWAAILAAANVALCPCLHDPVGWTVLEALACGCPAVTTPANAAASLLNPGTSGEVVVNRADAQALAAAMARLLATERAQRSRAFVAMASHLPTAADAADRLSGLLGEAMERRLRRACGLEGSDGTPTVSLPPPAPDQWIAGSTHCIASADRDSKALLRDVGLTVPESCWRPTGEHVVDGDADTVRCAWRAQGGGSRDRLFAPARVGTVFVTTWPADAEAGTRVYWLSRAMAQHGLAVPTPLAAGTDGRRSFIVHAEAAGLPLPEFLRTGGKPDLAAGRVIRRHALAAVARALARVHRTGLAFGVLEADSIFCALEPTGEVRVTFTGLTHMNGLPDDLGDENVTLSATGIGTETWLKACQGDLLWLALSLSRKLVPATERIATLRTWIGAAGVAVTPHAMVAAMDRLADATRTRRDAHVARHKAARETRAKARLARGELVPARAEDL